MICKGFTSVFTVKQNRGFTIIELIVVLAVIAILAAALIPALSTVVLNANIAALNSIARNLNIASQAYAQEKCANVFMRDAVAFAVSQGYSLSQLAAHDDAALLWDSQNDLFCVYDGNGINYPGADTTVTMARTASGYTDYWAVYQEPPAKQLFSIYWAAEKAFEEELFVGFDAVDNNSKFTLTYSGLYSETIAPVILFTSGQDIVVNSGKVYHYGAANKVHLYSTSPNIYYYEYGTVNEIIAEGNYCYIFACNGANFAQTKSDIIKIIGEQHLKVCDGADFETEPEHIHVFGEWINCGEQHIHYCKGCGCSEYGDHSFDTIAICSCGYTTLPPGLYCDGYNKHISLEDLIKEEYISESFYQGTHKDLLKKGEYQQYDIDIKNYDDFTMIFPSCIEKGIGNAFNNIEFLYRVIVPYGVTSIERDAFTSCTHLTEVYISTTLESIGDKAFTGCKSLSRVVIPPSVKEMKEKAFKNCDTVDCSAFDSKPDGWNENWTGRTTTVIWRNDKSN